MFKVEVDHSFIMINKGIKLTPKELVTNWMDTTNRNNKIELEHFHMFKPDQLEIMDITPNHLETTIKELTNEFSLVKYYRSFKVEFEEDIDLYAAIDYKVLLYEGKLADFKDTEYEIGENVDFTNFNFKVPSYVKSIKQFREYILSKDRFTFIDIHKLYPGMKVLGVTYENGKSTMKLFTVKNVITYKEDNEPMNYLKLDIIPIDRISIGSGIDHYIVVNNILVNYGGTNSGRF